MKKTILLVILSSAVFTFSSFAEDDPLKCAAVDAVVAGATAGTFAGPQAGGAAFVGGGFYGYVDAASDGKCDGKWFNNSSSSNETDYSNYGDYNQSDSNGWD